MEDMRKISDRMFKTYARIVDVNGKTQEEEILDLYKKALELQKKGFSVSYPIIFYFATMSALELEKCDEVLSIYYEAQKEDEIHKGVFKDAIFAAYKLKKFDEVLSIYADALRHKKTSQNIFGDAICAALELKNYDKALLIYDEALKLNQVDMRIFDKALYAAKELGNFEKIESIFQKIEKESRLNPRVFAFTIRILTDIEDITKFKNSEEKLNSEVYKKILALYNKAVELKKIDYDVVEDTLKAVKKYDDASKRRQFEVLMEKYKREKNLYYYNR